MHAWITVSTLTSNLKLQSNKKKFCFLKTLQIQLIYFYISVHGNWGDWTSWNECDRTCGDGNEKRYRYCDNPVKGPSGNDCDGPGFYTNNNDGILIKYQIRQRKCKIQECPGFNLLRNVL